LSCLTRGPAGGRLRGVPWTVRLRWLAWSTARRACPCGCGGFPRERIRPPGCSAICLRACLLRRARSFSGLAYAPHGELGRTKSCKLHAARQVAQDRFRRRDDDPGAAIEMSGEPCKRFRFASRVTPQKQQLPVPLAFLRQMDSYLSCHHSLFGRPRGGFRAISRGTRTVLCELCGSCDGDRLQYLPTRVGTSLAGLDADGYIHRRLNPQRKGMPCGRRYCSA